MDKNDRLTDMPRGPWLTEDEIRAILATGDNVAFDSIVAARERRRRFLRCLWPVGIAAAITAIVCAVWLLPKDGETVQQELAHNGGTPNDTVAETVPAPDEVVVPQPDVVLAAVSKRRTDRSRSADNVPGQPPVADAILAQMECDFEGVNTACADMIADAIMSYTTDEQTPTTIVIDL